MENIFDIDLSHFSIFQFFGLVIYGVFIYFVFWFVQHYLVHILIKSPVRKKRIINFLPVVFTLIWVFFTIYIFYFLVRPFPLYGILISTVLLYFGRGYLRNLVHGMFFRFKGDIAIGQKIKVDTHMGIISELKTFDLLLENKEGERIIIPYFTLAKQEIILKNFSSDFHTHSFSLVTNNNPSIKLIRKEIQLSPWVSSAFESKITKTKLDNNQVKFDILVHIVDEKYSYFIESDLRKIITT